MPMEHLIPVNYNLITNCNYKSYYLETWIFKIKISRYEWKALLDKEEILYIF